MRKLFFLAALAILPMPGPAQAQSAFNGTWKIDLSKTGFSTKPYAYLLMDGVYDCKDCTPPYKVKADGADQPVSGNPYYDSVAITVVDDHTIQHVHKKNGKVVFTSTVTISADGNTVVSNYMDDTASNGGPPVTGRLEATRVTSGPPGSNLVSGSWRTTKMESTSGNDTVWTYKVTGDEITMTNPTGQSYTAKLNGADAPMTGDPGITTVSVKMKGKDTLEETDKRNGKVISVFTMTVVAGGKSAKAVYDDKLSGETTAYPEVTKQKTAKRA